MSSRIIEIYRRPNNTRLPEEVYAGSNRKIGSFFGPNGSLVTGLTPEEEEAILPVLTGVPYDHPTFLQAKQTYYNEISIKVSLEGVKLEVGVDKHGRPIDPKGYVDFKYAEQHPWVAPNEKELSNPDYKFFIKDSQAELAKETKQIQSRKQAYKEFIKISDDTKKVDLIITLLGETPSKMGAESKEIFLENFVNTNPTEFYNVATDKRLEMKAFVLDCISAEVLQRVGTVILDGDEQLGDTVEEAALRLEDKANSDILTRLKARLQQYNK